MASTRVSTPRPLAAARAKTIIGPTRGWKNVAVRSGASVVAAAAPGSDSNTTRSPSRLTMAMR